MLAIVISKKYIRIPKFISYADLIEIRVDLIHNFELNWAKSFLQKVNKPWILTVRKKSQGGNFCGSENKRLNFIKKCLILKPDYLDFEYDTDLKVINEIKNENKNIKLIRSYHDFNQTPDDLNIFIKSYFNPLFDIYKFAFLANSIHDTFRMMCYLKGNKKSVSLIAMGKKGYPLRVTGKILNNAICYASPCNSSSVAGQLSIKKLIDVYNYKKINKKTKVYALIGENINHSIGHLFHNFFFLQNNINAVYIKIPLNKNDLEWFFKLAKTLPIEGVSITTPFKNALSFIPHKKKPINTLKKVNQRWEYKNTDGIGVFKILSKYLKKNSNLLILGAGPTAFVIYKELEKKVSIDVFNRSYSKAKLIYPKNINIINDLKSVDCSNYDIIINAASYKAKYDEKEIFFKTNKKSIFLNVSYQTNNLNNLKYPLVRFINGEDVFFSQAIYQQIFWNNREFSFDIIVKFKKMLMKDQYQ